MARRRKLRHVLRPLRCLAWPPQALVLAMFWALCSLLSLTRASALGRRMMRALGPRLRWHQQLRGNLAIACPQASSETLEALAREAWGNLGATLAEYPHLPAIAQGGRVEVVIDPEVERLIKGGRPLVFVTAHLGNWEVTTAAAAAATGGFSVVYAKQANPLIDRMVQHWRRTPDSRFLANDAGARPLLAELAAGRSLGLLADLRVDGGEPLAFFGLTAPTTLVPARLALKFGCPLVPVLVERLEGVRFRVSAQQPIRSSDPAASVAQQSRDMMQQVNRVLETWIAARPGSWQCLKRRWSKDQVRQRLSADAMVGPGGPRASAIGGSS